MFESLSDRLDAAMHKIKADRYFVATDEASYPILKKICDENDFECFAGDLNNVLKRFCDLIQKVKGETIIRATADNPFLFYEAVEASVLEFEERNKKKLTCDYLTYTGLPHGSGVEIFNGSLLGFNHFNQAIDCNYKLFCAKS